MRWMREIGLQEAGDQRGECPRFIELRLWAAAALPGRAGGIAFYGGRSISEIQNFLNFYKKKIN